MVWRFLSNKNYLIGINGDVFMKTVDEQIVAVNKMLPDVSDNEQHAEVFALVVDHLNDIVHVIITNVSLSWWVLNDL